MGAIVGLIVGFILMLFGAPFILSFLLSFIVAAAAISYFIIMDNMKNLARSEEQRAKEDARDRSLL